jgi:hypothetical protein
VWGIFEGITIRTLGWEQVKDVLIQKGKTWKL